MIQKALTVVCYVHQYDLGPAQVWRGE